LGIAWSLSASGRRQLIGRSFASIESVANPEGIAALESSAIGRSVADAPVQLGKNPPWHYVARIAINVLSPRTPSSRMLPSVIGGPWAA